MTHIYTRNHELLCCGSVKSKSDFLYKRGRFSTIIAALCLIVFQASGWAGTVDYINVNNPLLQRTPIAVPEFKSFTNTETERHLTNEALAFLKEGLSFIGYLKILNPLGFLANPAQTGIGIQNINFADWTDVGADLLITGGLEQTPSGQGSQGSIKLQLRLFDTYNQTLLAGKVYTGHPSRLRKMIHLFCGEISHALTGRWGVFSSRLAFVSTVKGKKEIFVSEFDGYETQQITRHKSICLSPAWSFDGKWMAYVSYAKGKPDLYITQIKDKTGAIVAHKGLNITPDWMPDRLQLAAALSFSGAQEIYLLTRKGEIIKKLSDSWGINVSPKFSPDGRQLAFVSNRTGSPQIYIKDLESGQTRRLTFQGKYNTSPAWSPDGSRIAYVGIEKNTINIFLIATDPKSSRLPVQLTRGQGDNEDPSFSPDGSMITFSSNRNNRVSKIFIMTAGGADQRQLVFLDGSQTQPRWSGTMRSSQ